MKINSIFYFPNHKFVCVYVYHWLYILMVRCVYVFQFNQFMVMFNGEKQLGKLQNVRCGFGSLIY